MKTTFALLNNRTYFALTIAASFAFTGCAGITQQEKGTAIGAGVGAAGAMVLGAGTLGTLGGAAAGGAIGHEIKKPK